MKTLIALAIAHLANAWVLLSPFPRAHIGQGYSRIADDTTTTHDWPGPAYPDLNALVWPWPAAAHPDDGQGLGKSITYALHPDFCDELLPKFPEDGARGGHLDGFLSMLDCNSLKMAIHLAFTTWAANSPHLSFLDRTDECARPGAPVANQCSRA